jgi:hypothetical protein
MPSLPVIVFIPCSGAGCKPDEYDGEWLPRDCPCCGQMAVIGHGRRCRQAHDRLHDSIQVRRGICRRCHRTLTVLPCYCIPGAQFSLPARQEAMARLAEGQTLEQAAPECRDPDRIADPSTVLRWAWRRIQSLRFAFRRTPTILAWDFFAVSRMLSVEASPP